MSKELWNARAALGAESGTRDLIAVELERRLIERYVTDGMHVIDVGCGNGETLIRLARRHPNMRAWGFAYAPAMIASARAAWEADPLYQQPLGSGFLTFLEMDLADVAFAVAVRMKARKDQQ